MILVVPHYAIAEYTSPQDGTLPPRVSPRFVTELISGDRQLTISQMQKVARLLEIEPIKIPLREPLEGSDIETKIIEKVIAWLVVEKMTSLQDVATLAAEERDVDEQFIDMAVAGGVEALRKAGAKVAVCKFWRRCRDAFDAASKPKLEAEIVPTTSRRQSRLLTSHRL